MSAFGENLKFLRSQAGFTAAGLAERSGMSVNSINSYEIGRSNPSLRAAQRLADALGVEIKDLLFPSEEELDRAIVDARSDIAEKLAQLVQEMDKESAEALLRVAERLKPSSDRAKEKL
ncbi:helix-turn-helix domain-containing protein [Ponticaulis profundi]|uniref:Helix-turn-helix domain-containing protein n=1 Tax=Ponticaulis profundi TaxID=2665222 RepID=A0ABW1S811_9PROT